MNYKQVDYEALSELPLEKRKRGNPRTRDKRRYKGIICAFDIETTRLSDRESVMYIWQCQIGSDITVTGRSWKECMRFFKRLAACCKDLEYFVIYVHNLSFEFQFLRGWYHFTRDEVFATGPRKVLKCEMMQHLEFRCSYLHTNMSLGEYLDKMGVEHKKTELDYEKKRWPWTPLTDSEMEYAVNDVRGLVEALHIEMDHDGDNLYSVPMTSTGYVRRDVKKAMRELNHLYVRAMLPDWETYIMLRQAFRGGNTHANRYYAGVILHGVGSVDIASSYPTQQCNHKFPVSKFIHDPDPSPERLAHLIYKRKKAVLARIQLWDVRLSDATWGCPYIPIDKCSRIHGEWMDNGRVLAAEFLEITVTDIDFKIILSEYKYEKIAVVQLDYARYGWLPDPLLDVIQDYFRVKTTASGIARSKAKAKLNSIYGMSAQNPVRVNTYFDADAPESFTEDTDAWGPELLEEVNRRAFFPYQWGIWTTAWARWQLETAIRRAHEQGDYVYCDTDSVKYIGDVDFSDLNAELREDSDASMAYADDKDGVRRYMGVWEDDGHYKRFATRGAKKYAYEDEDGHLHITIAGVNKRAGARELEAAGGLDHFLDPVFIFTEDENESVYVDHVRRFEYIDGHRIRISPCVTIRPSTKTLSDTEEYMELLKDPAAFADFRLQILENRANLVDNCNIL